MLLIWHGALRRISPETRPFRERPSPLGVAAAGYPDWIGMGQRVTWRAKHFGVRQTHQRQITAMDRPAYFQTRDPVFQFMRHDHFFRAVPPDRTEMRDVFCFAAPLPVLGRLAEIAFLRRYMRALLGERNAVLKEIAESPEWQGYLAS
jgi:hypothetical protein